MESFESATALENPLVIENSDPIAAFWLYIDVSSYSGGHKHRVYCLIMLCTKRSQPSGQRPLTLIKLLHVHGPPTQVFISLHFPD